MSTLTAQEIVAWLRTHGHKLLDAANAVEAALSQPEAAAAAPSNQQPEGMTRFKRTPTAQLIRDRLRQGHSRVPHLAKEFGAPEETIRAIVDNRENGIVMKERGWLYLREDLNGG